jgi:hypothetical protein
MENVIRPQMITMEESALIPPQNLIRPAPNQFTHTLKRPQAYRFDQSPNAQVDGELAKGTRVVLLFHEDGPLCRVANEEGLYVEIEFDSLKKI